MNDARRYPYDLLQGQGQGHETLKVQYFFTFSKSVYII